MVGVPDCPDVMLTDGVVPEEDPLSEPVLPGVVAPLVFDGAVAWRVELDALEADDEEESVAGRVVLLGVGEGGGAGGD